MLRKIIARLQGKTMMSDGAEASKESENKKPEKE